MRGNGVDTMAMQSTILLAIAAAPCVAVLCAILFSAIEGE